jgi:hypothetical protein
MSKGAKPIKAPILRNAAQDESCTLMLDCCNGDKATTVLAHLRCFGWAGMAQKPDDFLAVFACSACHDVIDGRSNEAFYSVGQLLHALGETLRRQFASGNLTIKGQK